MASREKKFGPLCLILFLGTPACNAGGGPVAFESYCDEYVGIVCNAAEKCDCLEGYTIEMCHYIMRADCVDSVEDPVNAGTMTYDAAEAGRCLTGTKSVIGDCSLEGDDYPDSCDTMLTGAVQAGGSCGGSDECRPGLECHNDLCTAMPGASQPCLDGSYCAEDLYCGPDVLCHPYKGRGESCADGSWVCGDDLYCDSRSSTCQPYLGEGESCAHDHYACGDDLYCSDSSQTCRSYPGNGQGCLDSGGSCADDLYCDAADNLCKEPMPAGSICTDGEQCASGDCTDNLCAGDTGDSCPFSYP